MTNVTIRELRELWKKEYGADFSGWDFSRLAGRWHLERPPWDYGKLAKQLMEHTTSVLDIDTGGGEFLASLAPLPRHTCATESWHPNTPVAKATLEPLGVTVVETDDTLAFPFKPGEFETVLNRHGAARASEIYRILKPGGYYLTQQVAGDNLRDFVDVFDHEAMSPFAKQTFTYWQHELCGAGFILTQAKEWSGEQEFYDVGAIAYYIKAIPWTVPGFDIDKNLPDLERLQRKLEAGERLVFTQRRFLFMARKPIV